MTCDVTIKMLELPKLGITITKDMLQLLCLQFFLITYDEHLPLLGYKMPLFNPIT